MIVPVLKIVYYSKMEYCTLSNDRVLIELFKRVNSNKNVVRVYYSDHDYIEIPLSLTMPTIIHPIGLIAYPDVSMGIAYCREIEESHKYNFAQISEILYDMTAYQMEQIGLDDFDGFVFELDEPIPIKEGMYTIDNMDRLLETSFDNLYYCNNKEDYRNVTPVIQLTEEDYDSIEAKLVGQYFVKFKEIIDEIDLSENKVVFELTVRNNSVYVSHMTIRNNYNEYEHSVVYSNKTGRVLIASEYLYECYKEGLRSPKEDFINRVKTIVSSNYFENNTIVLGKLDTLGIKPTKIARSAFSAMFIQMGAAAVIKPFGEAINSIKSRILLNSIK